MVAIPDAQLFCDENERSGEIYTTFLTKIVPLAKQGGTLAEIRKKLYDLYQEIDAYFENKIRSNHANDSANEIRRHSELNFIEEMERELVAEVSGAHGYDISDVYYTKSTGTVSLINKKQIEILLRLADLLDISRYRISKLLLRNNLENMNRISRFHWLSHLVTDGYSFSTTYKPKSLDNQNSSYIQCGTITERINITVNVRLSQTSPVRNLPFCHNVSESSFDTTGQQMLISCESGAVCSGESCNFLCAWFMKKNDYLISEFAALQERYPVLSSALGWQLDLRRMLVESFSVFYVVRGDYVIVTDALYSASDIERRLDGRRGDLKGF